jgi:cell division protein FtsB
LQANETTAQLSENLTEAQQWSTLIEERLQENTEDLAAAHDNLALLSQQNTALKNENAKLQAQAGKTGLIGFGFAALGFSAGTPLIAEGIQRDNYAMLLAGTGTIIGTSGIWLLGRYLFHWW